jgi:hypothetical protein
VSCPVDRGVVNRQDIVWGLKPNKNGGYPYSGYAVQLMLHNKLANPNNQLSESNMNDETETIPWLVYPGIGLDGQDGEGPDEAGGEEEERQENEQWWEAGSQRENYEGDNAASIRLRHIIRVHVEESVTAIRTTAFMNCTELREIRIPDTVTVIGNNAFAFCESLVAIQFPGPLRIIMWNAFAVCRSLTSVGLPDSVVSIGAHAFDRCTALQSIRLPGGITRIELGTFSWCSALATLEIPGSVISIESLAFTRCQSLRAVTIPAPSNLSRIGRSAFAMCPRLAEIDVGKMAVALWPRLLRQLGSRAGLFGHGTGIEDRQRRSFVLFFLWKHMMQFFERGSTVGGGSTKRQTPAVQDQVTE